MEDRSPPTITYCDLRLRYDSIHWRAVPETPNTDRRRLSRTEWSMVSNAAERSKPINTAVSVLCSFLYADCSELKLPELMTCGRSRLRHSRSTILDIVLKFEMGR